MRILRLAVVAMLVFPVATYAQQDAGGRGGRMSAALFQGITLTDAQQKQVDSIRTVYQPQIQSASDREARRGIMQKQTADFRTILTPDQQTQFDKNLADLRSRMRGGGPPQ